MLAVKERYESLIREFANMDLCNKWSCYHCFKKKCPVREDAIKKVADYISNTDKRGRSEDLRRHPP